MATSASEARQAECDMLLDSADLIINKQADVISMLTDQNAGFRKAVEEGRGELERRDSWTSSPWLYAGMGLIAGVFMYRELRQP